MSGSPVKLALFVVLKGPIDEREIEFYPGESVTFGRGNDADYTVDDRRLSRVHCLVQFDPKTARLKIRDLQSRNGILVNNRRIKSTWLQQGDRITFGQNLIEVRYERQSSSGFDLEDEETEVVSNLIFCEHCGDNVGPIAVRQGQAKARNGCYLCVECSLILEVNSSEFMHFEVQDKLGKGAAGLVYKARDKKRDQVCALKVLRPSPKLKKKHIYRFVQEPKLLKKLDHPHIIKVYESANYARGFYMSLEYLPGQSLADVLAKTGPLPIKLILRVGMQMASALHHASERGVIHRDVKPGNILFAADTGIAKLTDFGLARDAKRDPKKRRVTRQGEGLGSPTYMPPEQMRNARGANARNDIYSLGATMFHLATGELPIGGRNYEEFEHQLKTVEPKLVTEIRPEAPFGLSIIIRRCLQKDPDNRFQSAAELFAELKDLDKAL